MSDFTEEEQRVVNVVADYDQELALQVMSYITLKKMRENQRKDPACE